MDAALLDWNVSWVFNIENSPRDKPFQLRYQDGKQNNREPWCFSFVILADNINWSPYFRTELQG